MAAVESLVEYIIQEHHDFTHLVFQSKADDIEVIVCIQHIQVFYHLLVGDVSLRETRCLIEDGEGIAHTTVGLFGDDGQCLLFILYVFLFRHVFKVTDDVRNSHALEIVDLAA